MRHRGTSAAGLDSKRGWAGFRHRDPAVLADVIATEVQTFQHCLARREGVGERFGALCAKVKILLCAKVKILPLWPSVFDRTCTCTCITT